MGTFSGSFVGGVGTGLGLALAVALVLLLATATGSEILRKAVGQ